MAKYFDGSVTQYYKIKDEDGVVGELGVRPNAVLWRPRNKQRFYRVTIEELEAEAERINHTVEQ